MGNAPSCAEPLWNRQTTGVKLLPMNQRKADLVEIRWPSGIVQQMRDVAGDRVLTVKEPVQ